MKKYCRKIVALFLLPCLFLLISVPVFALDNCAVLGSKTITMRPMAADDTKYELLVNDQAVVRYRSMDQGLSASQRASIILERLKKLALVIGDNTVSTGLMNGAPVVLVNNDLLITVTKADWEANNSTGDGLARVWAQNIIRAFSATAPSGGGVPENPPVENPPAENPPAENPPAENPPVENPAINDPSQDQNPSSDTDELKMLSLVNKEREKAGISPLVMDEELVKIARLKSQDLIDKNYFSHQSPTYGDPFAMMKNFGVTYSYAGENLAGNHSVEKAHESLMNSPGHRANILNPNYTKIGIGIVEGGPYGIMFTQLFIRP